MRRSHNALRKRRDDKRQRSKRVVGVCAGSTCFRSQRGCIAILYHAGDALAALSNYLHCNKCEFERDCTRLGSLWGCVAVTRHQCLSWRYPVSSSSEERDLGSSPF